MNLEILRDKIVNEMGMKDIELKTIEVVKNDVLYRGIRIISHEGEKEDFSVNPVIYYSPEETVSDVAAKIVQAIKCGYPNFDYKKWQTREFFEANAFLGISKRNGENEKVLKKKFLNFDLIIRVRVLNGIGDGKEGCIKATRELLKAWNVTEEEAFDIAISNTLPAVRIQTIEEALGIPGMEKEPTIFIMSADNMVNGAAAIYFTEVLQEFCKKHGFKEILIIPSSTEEMMIINAEGADPKEILEINKDINSSEVEPFQQLEPCVYRYNAEYNLTTCAASYMKVD